MSGYDPGSAACHGVAPDDHFLSKPFTPVSLRAAVERALGLVAA